MGFRIPVQCQHFFTAIVLLGFTSGALWVEVASAEVNGAEVNGAEEITTEKPMLGLARVEEVHVWGKSRQTGDTGYVNPTSLLTQEDMRAINTVTTEDLVKFEPSLVIRRRFIGDSNGTLGIRGSNMFQTSRSMVFADGVPLHYFLQSRWSGAPRWTMVSASEIAQIEVIYGPFSAEYGGNAMGGVVLIETAIPEEQALHFDGSYFTQAFNAYGFDTNLDGFKGFISYGDKIGNASMYFSYNHLNNSAQPQTFRDSRYAADPDSRTDTVAGGIFGNNSVGIDRIWYGDTGIVETTTDNYKFKFGYDFGDWQSLLNVAYEDRNSSNVGQSYIKDADGNTLWSGSEHVQVGQLFSFNTGNQRTSLNANELLRESFSLGLRLKGQLNENTRLEANLNYFDVLRDEIRSSERNPQDPNFTPNGEISAYDDSGWNTAELKMVVGDFGIKGMELISGVRYEAYELNLNVYASPDYAAGSKGDYRSRFGGQTEITASFAQANWKISQQWDVSLGLRYEHFKSSNGYYDAGNATTPELDLVAIPRTSKDALSPKFSLGYRPQSNWLVRYSLAKASRFPIVEELFSQYKAYNTVAQSNPELAPETGIHHNVMVDKTLDDGYLRINVFQETVNDAIESQTDTSTNVRSFVPIDKVDVKGVEFIANKGGFVIDALDLRFNLTWTDATIVDNSTAESAENYNPADSFEGNTYPRMPKWRSNVLATYHLSDAWDLSASIQYASSSFANLDNSDTEPRVYGAQDGYTRIGLKTAYQVNEQWNVSLGIDNLTNNVAYVAHPWPGRTLYLNFSFDYF